MKKLLFLILISISNFAIGQQITFRNEKVDTLEIESTVGYYNISKRKSIGKSDNFIIVYDRNSNKYVVSNYIKAKYKISTKDYIDRGSQKDIKEYKFKIVDRELIEQLLGAFNENTYPITFEHLNQTETEFNELTNEKSIKKVAKARKVDWHFKRRYSMPEDNKKVFQGCQDIDLFNLFLSQQFQKEAFPTIVTDHSNYYAITIITDKQVFRFDSSYPDIYRQPWFDFSPNPELSIDSLEFKSVLNFEVNKHLEELLPNDFLNLYSIRKESLYFAFIVWYLERQGIK
jgi:hypothetical protein